VRLQPPTRELPVRGRFSLAAGTGFLEGFAPAGPHDAGPETLVLAFPVAGDWRTAGAIVSQRGDPVMASVYGDADPAEGACGVDAATLARYRWAPLSVARRTRCGGGGAPAPLSGVAGVGVGCSEIVDG
jgi:hypothetical protein